MWKNTTRVVGIFFSDSEITAKPIFLGNPRNSEDECTTSTCRRAAFVGSVAEGWSIHCRQRRRLVPGPGFGAFPWGFCAFRFSKDPWNFQGSLEFQNHHRKIRKNANFLNFWYVFAVFLNFSKQYTKTKHRIVNNIVLDISWSEKQQNLADAEKICVFSQAQLENSAKWSFTKMIVLGFGLDLKFKMIDHFSEYLL